MIDVANPTLELRAMITVTEADINLLLAAAALIRRSYLGADGELVDGVTDDYAEADRFEDLAELLWPFCVPPLTELEQECPDCDEGVKWGRACNTCRGTALLPPTRDGVRVRLLPKAAT